jgi:quercetin dioxygenase-like cupin family protein
MMLACGLLALQPAQAAFAPQPKVAAQHFSFKGQRPSFHEDHIDDIEVVVGAANSEGHLSLIESEWLPSFTARPHYHRYHHETFYVISGQVEWTIGGKAHIMKAGDLVHIPPNTIHTVRVIGTEKVHSLMFYQPGGYEEAAAIGAMLTPAEKKEPRMEDLLDRVGDFNLVSGIGAPWQEPAAGQPRKGVPIFSFHGQRKSRTEKNVENIEVDLSSIDSEGAMSIIESDWLPGFTAPPHFHKTHGETFYVFSGKVEWTVGGETHILKAGDAVHIPPNTVHSVKVLEKIHTLWIGTPGGLDEGPDRVGDMTLMTPKEVKTGATAAEKK